MIKERYLATTLILCSCITMAMADNVIAESTSFSNNNVPSYENGVLTIPRVDTPDQIGNYQDATLKFDPQLNTWILQQVNPAKFNSSNPKIKSVHVFTIDLFQRKSSYKLWEISHAVSLDKLIRAGKIICSRFKYL